ncbi:hypothetical protein Q6247_27200, partial [Klebsiella pneumoniae]
VTALKKWKRELETAAATAKQRNNIPSAPPSVESSPSLKDFDIPKVGAEEAQVLQSDAESQQHLAKEYYQWIEETNFSN